MSPENESDSPVYSKTVISAVNLWADKTVVKNDNNKVVQNYKAYTVRKILFIVLCLVVIVITAGIAVKIGPYDIGFAEAYQIIWNYITGTPQDPTLEYVVIDLRCPRIAVAIIAGAGLAVAGTAMQSTLLNPLADPYTTGISSGASFGATLAIIAGATIAAGKYAIVVNAFVFSLLPLAVILGVSALKRASPTTMIMAGIAVMYIFNACTTVMMLMANPNDMQAVYEWQVGSVAHNTWEEVPLMLSITLVGVLLTQFFSRKLNALATGDESASSLGINVNSMRMIILLIVSLMSAAIVSFTGMIGFVGLVAPHIARLFVGADNRYLVPASAVLGAALLVTADVVGRVIIAPAILPVGVVMAFLGGPMFLWLMLKRNSQVWG